MELEAIHVTPSGLDSKLRTCVNLIWTILALTFNSDGGCPTSRAGTNCTMCASKPRSRMTVVLKLSLIETYFVFLQLSAETHDSVLMEWTYALNAGTVFSSGRYQAMYMCD